MSKKVKPFDRFYVGQIIELENPKTGKVDLVARVAKGKNAKGDMILQFRTEGWYTPRQEFLYLMAVFKAHVEDNNYPNGQGRWKLWQRLEEAFETGWRAAAAKTFEEREKAEQRRAVKNGLFW